MFWYKTLNTWSVEANRLNMLKLYWKNYDVKECLHTERPILLTLKNVKQI